MDVTRQDGAVVRVAVVGPLSGPNTEWGLLLTEAAAAVRQLSVRWELFDDRGGTDGAVARAEDVVADGGFAAVLTHLQSDGAHAVLDVYRAAGLPVLLPLATAPGRSGFRTEAEADRTVLRLHPGDRSQIAAIVRACQERGKRRLAVLHDGSDRGRQLAGRLTEAAATNDTTGPELSVQLHEVWPDNDGTATVVVCGTRSGAARLLHRGLSRQPGHLVVLTDDCDILAGGPLPSTVVVTRLVGGAATRVTAAFAALGGALTKHPALRGAALLDMVRGELADVFDPAGDLLDGTAGSGWEVRPQRPLRASGGSAARRHHDIAVLGGGMVGRAAAAELAEGGASVVLLDDGTPGSSASAVSGALIRAFELDARERDLACEAFLSLWGRPGPATAYGYHRTGALVLLSPADLEEAAAGIAELGKAGVAAELISVPELNARWPDVNTAGLAAAVWEPGAGYTRPTVAMAAMLDRARQAGVELLPHHRVDSLTASPDGSVVLSGSNLRDDICGRTEVHAEVVLVAAGIASPGLLGNRWPTDRPARTKHIRYAIFNRGDRRLPTIVDAATGAWARPDGLDGMLAGYPAEEWDLPPTPTAVPDERQVQWIRDGVSPLLPFLAEAKLLTGSSGTDLFVAGGPALGPLPGLPRAVVAAGWSGAGFKTSPAAAHRAAEAAAQLLGERRRAAASRG
ncbi:FAD-dependent oxidoreductase [Streptomyces sp. LN500]|uniref:FAD-dependent oxidoreductase n=1 Tax=Streptomyces sp. LN500 TaxID=3112978 RepID=UPI003711C30A